MRRCFFRLLRSGKIGLFKSLESGLRGNYLLGVPAIFTGHTPQVCEHSLFLLDFQGGEGPLHAFGVA